MEAEVLEVTPPVVTDDVKPESTVEVTATPTEEVEKKQVEPAKTFTQAEVDALVQKRLLKEERRVHRRVEQQLREQQQAEALNPPKRESFRDDDAYLQAQIDHRAEVLAAQKLAEREKAEAAERQSESFAEKAEKAVERYPDFQAVVSNPSLRINEQMVEFITVADAGADVAYYLGKNPSKAAEIAGMSPVKATLALKQIADEIASRPKPAVSKAPEPITPVGTRGTSSTQKDPSEMTDREFAAWRKSQIRARS